MDSLAWAHFGLPKPPRGGGWVRGLFCGGWSCCIDQKRYGHRATKPTWLYYVGPVRPPVDLAWGLCKVQGKGTVKRGELENLSKRQRAATPEQFRDLLLSLARRQGGRQ